MTRTPEGFLRADAYLTRTGVFEYTNLDGTTRRELRLPEHVFDAKSLESFDLKPLTLGHPPTNLDSTTARDRSVGVVSSPRKAEDGEHVAATISIFDAAAIEAVERGVKQLSNGYTLVPVPIPNGVHTYADGTTVRADFYQTEIVGNHTAIVPRGRAGATASLRLDAEGNANTDQESDPMTLEEMRKMLEAQAADAKAQAARLDALTAEAAKTKADAEAAKAKLEKAEGENVALKARLDAADKREAEAAKARADAEKRELAERVAPLLGKPLAEVLALESPAIKRALVTKEVPGVDLNGRSDAYVDGIFEGVLATRRDTAGLVAGQAHRVAAHNDGDGVADAMKAAKDRSENAWKTAS